MQTRCFIWLCPTLFLQHIHYQFKREEIEFPIIHRINSVFRRATNKWKVPCSRHSVVLLAVYQSVRLLFRSHRCPLFPQDDVQLWLSHVAFCKKWVCNCLIIFFRVQLKSDTVFSNDNGVSPLWGALIRPPRARSARCSHQCLLYTLTSPVSLFNYPNPTLRSCISSDRRGRWYHLQTQAIKSSVYLLFKLFGSWQPRVSWRIEIHLKVRDICFWGRCASIQTTRKSTRR